MPLHRRPGAEHGHVSLLCLAVAAVSCFSYRVPCMHDIRAQVPLVGVKFSAQGDILITAQSYDWSQVRMSTQNKKTSKL